MPIFKMNGKFWKSSPFSDKVTELELEHQPKKKTVVIELTYEDGRMAQYRQPNEIGPYPWIKDGFIEVCEDEYVTTKGVSKIKVWKEVEE